MNCISLTSHTTLKKTLPLQNIEVLSMYSTVGHGLSPIESMHCGIMLVDAKFAHTFIVSKILQKELVMGLNMQPVHHLGCDWTENNYMFLHQGTNQFNKCCYK